MAQHVNFYENMKEAEMRLSDTVVTYDGVPYYVLCICDHKADGIFRMYLAPIGQDGGLCINHYPVPYHWMQETPNGPTRGDKMDEFMEAHPQCGIIRKMMNSPAFNKFRPFPLGMMNTRGMVTFVERQPTRHTQQGLTSSMLTQSVIRLEKDDGKNSRYAPGVDYTSAEFAATVMGEYPDAKDCISKLTDPKIANKGLAFHRNFAFVRGPLDLLFLAYKSDVVGFLPNTDLSTVRLSPEFKYVAESVAELNLFENIHA